MSEPSDESHVSAAGSEPPPPPKASAGGETDDLEVLAPSETLPAVTRAYDSVPPGARKLVPPPKPAKRDSQPVPAGSSPPPGGDAPLLASLPPVNLPAVSFVEVISSTLREAAAAPAAFDSSRPLDAAGAENALSPEGEVPRRRSPLPPAVTSDGIFRPEPSTAARLARDFAAAKNASSEPPLAAGALRESPLLAEALPALTPSAPPAKVVLGQRIISVGSRPPPGLTPSAPPVASDYPRFPAPPAAAEIPIEIDVSSDAVPALSALAPAVPAPSEPQRDEAPAPAPRSTPVAAEPPSRPSFPPPSVRPATSVPPLKSPAAPERSLELPPPLASLPLPFAEPPLLEGFGTEPLVTLGPPIGLTTTTAAPETIPSPFSAPALPTGVQLPEAGAPEEPAARAASDGELSHEEEPLAVSVQVTTDELATDSGDRGPLEELGREDAESVPPDEPTPSPTRPETKAPPPPPKRAPAPASAPSEESKKKSKQKRPWWEELFSEDFVRANWKVSDSQIRREVSFVEESLGVAAGGVVLDLGCGPGQHAVELAARGYGVVGYDLSLYQLALAADVAQERSQKINFLQGDMREMAFEEMFDGVFSWNTSFGYFEEEKNYAVAERVFRALRPGGMFLVDVMNRDFVAAHTPSSVWFEGDSCVCMDDAVIDYYTSRLRVKRSLILDDGRTRECTYSVRLYSFHELGKLLHEVGFRVTEVSGHPATPGVFLGQASPRIIMLAQKP